MFRFWRNKYNKLLIALLAFHSFFFLVFQYLNKSFQTWDSAGHIGTAFSLADRTILLFKGEIGLIDFLQTSDYYPPFIQSIGAVISLIFGYNSSLLLFISLVFFLLAITFLYKVMLHLTSNAKYALITATIFSFFPQIFEQSRVFHLDLPLIALSLITFFFFLKSRCFERRLYALFFFMFFGLVQLTKWYGFIYVSLPVLYVLFEEIQNGCLLDLDRRKKMANNFLLGLFVFIFTAMPWYYANLEAIIKFSAVFSTPEIDDPQVFLSVENFIYYYSRVLSHQILLVPFILSILGAIKLSVDKRKVGLATIIYFFIPILIFTFIKNKNLRYVLPLTPLYAAWIGYFITNLPGIFSKYKNVILYVVLGYMLIIYMLLSFNQIKSQSKIMIPVGAILSGPYYTVWYYTPTLYSYNNEYWPIDDILQYIADDSGNNLNVAIGVTPLIDSKEFSLASMEMLRRENKFTNMYLPVPYLQFEPFSSDEEIEGYFKQNDVSYVLVPQDAGPFGLRNYAVLDQLIKYFLSSRNKIFQPIETFKMPDNSVLVLFKKTDNNIDGIQVDDHPTGNYCINSAGFGDGVESIKLTPNHTYVIYSGHFALLDILRKDYKEGELNVLHIENIPHESILDIHNLPIRGTSLCVYDSLDIDISESINAPLVEPGHCGVDCSKVYYYQWRVGDINYNETVFERGDNILVPKFIDSYGIE